MIIYLTHNNMKETSINQPGIKILPYFTYYLKLVQFCSDVTDIKKKSIYKHVQDLFNKIETIELSNLS